MRRTAVIAAAIALAWVPASSAGPIEVVPGVTFEHRLMWTAAGPVQQYVVTAPKPGGLYAFVPLLSNGTVSGRETVSSMERDVSARMTTIGVNGDFFNWSGGWPSGLLIQGGIVEHQPVPDRASAGIDTAGNLHVDRVTWSATWHGTSTLSYPLEQLNEPPQPNATALFTPVWGATTPPVRGVAVTIEPFPPTAQSRDLTGTVTGVADDSSVQIPSDGAVLVARGSAVDGLRTDAPIGGQVTVRIPLRPDWASVTDAVSGGPTLVKNGVPIANAGEALTPVQLRGRDPRTAIGQRSDGGLVLVAVDGRRPGWSIGISNWDLALTLIRYGCVTGFAMDSGGSTTIALDGRVLNRPSDPSGERPVAEAVVVAYAGVYVPLPAPTLSPNRDGAAERETLTYKLVRPSTVSAKLIAPDGSSRVLASGAKGPGMYRISWNGMADNGAPAPEGTYHWNVTATDDLGRTSSDDRTFTIDNTLGFLRFSRGARRISFTLARDASIRVTIETLNGDILRTVAAKTSPAGVVTVLWNGKDGRGRRVRRGTYVVHVYATSVIGLSQLTGLLRIR